MTAPKIQDQNFPRRKIMPLHTQIPNALRKKVCIAVTLLTVLLALPSHAQITPSADAYTNTASPTTNYGAAATLNVESASQTTYIQFDLSAIPAGYTGANVAKASLKLYVNAVGTAGIADKSN